MLKMCDGGYGFAGFSWPIKIPFQPLSQLRLTLSQIMGSWSLRQCENRFSFYTMFNTESKIWSQMTREEGPVLCLIWQISCCFPAQTSCCLVHGNVKWHMSWPAWWIKWRGADVYTIIVGEKKCKIIFLSMPLSALWDLVVFIVIILFPGNIKMNLYFSWHTILLSLTHTHVHI